MYCTRAFLGHLNFAFDFTVKTKIFSLKKCFLFYCSNEKTKKQIIASLGHLNFVSVSPRKTNFAVRNLFFLLLETKSKNKTQSGCSQDNGQR
jgi:hypothetical protein